jgi:hypothetical protein
MSTMNIAPDSGESYVNKDGTAVERFYRWVESTASDILRLNTGDTYYDDLSDINAKISTPIIGQKAMVDGQGLAVYNKSTTWVLASDDTTAIT